MARVKRLWGEQAGAWTSDQCLHWTEHPKVQERMNYKITGRQNSERYHHFVYEILGGFVPVDCALTLGCGGGDLERGLVQYNFARRHDAFDVSEGAIEKARNAAHAAGLTHIQYEVYDLNKPRFPENRYDVVFGISSVHHVAELESLYENVYRTLKPGGWFYMNEFVGPSQFQWPDRQVAAINEILRRIPQRLRIDRRDGKTLYERYNRPSIEYMNDVDPSEAIRSAEIIPLLERYFPNVEITGYGGSILHQALEGIAGNFVDTDAESMQWLDRIFAYEDELIASGELAHDFAVIMARKT